MSLGGISGANGATCGIGLADSVVYCAGGANVAADSVFRPVQEGFRALAIALGRGHACAIGLDRAAYCWGQDVRGAVGPDVTSTLVPQRIPGNDEFVHVTSGSHSCGITAQRVLKCWGSNQNGQLGIGAADTVRHTVPETVDLGDGVTSVLAGNSYTCAVTDGGALYCWGSSLPLTSGFSALLGTRLHAPVRFAAGVEFLAVTADSRRVCGLTRGQAIVCL
jgi:hypothetical protein